MNRFLLLFFLLLCSSCIQLGGEPQPTRFYLLEATAEPSADHSAQTIQLDLGPIEFPTYLDRPQIVTRDHSNAIAIADHDRWAEPLPENFTRTLQENLTKAINGGRINSAPWTATNSKNLSLKVTLNRFDGIIGQQTEVDIRWTLFGTDGSTELQRKHFIAKTPISDSYQALVEGLNKALAKLSSDIALAVTTHFEARAKKKEPQLRLPF